MIFEYFVMKTCKFYCALYGDTMLRSITMLRYIVVCSCVVKFSFRIIFRHDLVVPLGRLRRLTFQVDPQRHSAEHHRRTHETQRLDLVTVDDG